MLVNTPTHEVSELKRIKEGELGRMGSLAKLVIISVLPVAFLVLSCVFTPV